MSDTQVIIPRARWCAYFDSPYNCTDGYTQCFMGELSYFGYDINSERNDIYPLLSLSRCDRIRRPRSNSRYLFGTQVGKGEILERGI